MRLLIVATLLTACAPDLVKLEGVQTPWIFAHRGGAAEAPENTLNAFMQSAALSEQVIIEMDVHLSKDGEVVVIHDASVDRTTDGTGKVASMTLAELKALDAAYCFSPGEPRGTAADCPATGNASDFPLRGQGIEIPTLQEALNTIDENRWISIEAKKIEVVPHLAKLVKGRGKVIVGAEYDPISRALLEELPEYSQYMPEESARCHVIAGLAKGDTPSCPHYGIFASPRTSSGFTLDTEAVIERFQRKGIRVIYWTINEASQMKELVSRGADGIITDAPSVALGELTP